MQVYLYVCPPPPQMTYIIFVIDVAKLSSIKESQTEDAIRKWLKYACDRDRGRKMRAEKQKCKLLDDIACFSVICTGQNDVGPPVAANGGPPVAQQ